MSAGRLRQRRVPGDMVVALPGGCPIRCETVIVPESVHAKTASQRIRHPACEVSTRRMRYISRTTYTQGPMKRKALSNDQIHR